MIAFTESVYNAFPRVTGNIIIHLFAIIFHNSQKQLKKAAFKAFTFYVQITCHIFSQLKQIFLMSITPCNLLHQVIDSPLLPAYSLPFKATLLL